jgi:hypothetical protein
MSKPHARILQIWDSNQALASATGAKPEAVKKWRQRGRIPSRYWPKVIVAAAVKQKTVTLDMLARAA